MERVPVRESDQHTSAMLARVETGEPLEVAKDGRPVARLVPIDGSRSFLDRLIAEDRRAGHLIQAVRLQSFVSYDKRWQRARSSRSRNGVAVQRW